MTSCCQQHQMRWSGATGAIARGKRVSTGCGRKRRSVRALRWICGVKPKPKAGNKPLQHFIVHGLDKPGSFATVSILAFLAKIDKRRGRSLLGGTKQERMRPETPKASRLMRTRSPDDTIPRQRNCDVAT